MSNSTLKSERGGAVVCGTRKGRGRFNVRLTKPSRRRAFLLEADSMVAPAVEVFAGRVPLCNARNFLDAANDAHEAGQYIKAAVLLREAIKRYMIAHCEFSAVPLPSSKNPKAIIKAYRDAGNECVCWVDEIIDHCNAVICCRKPIATMDAILSVTYAIFGSDFQRNGGVV